mmetsp:Transcript_7682/g.11311  ORF Transcript_7682/g.11311 Transcript_7682/m.11311 type:complete len:208 (-) Transcript_7682:26-649(-)
MSELFKGYEKDFSKHLASANKKISSLSSGLNTKNLLSEAKQELSEAEHWLRQMESELFTLPPQLANQFQPRLNRHKENVQGLKKNIESEETRSNKKDLLGKSAQNEREKLLTNNEILQDSGEGLERTLRLGLESEQLGNDTMNNLKKQRGQIQNINERVNDVGTNLNKANRVITTMDRRRVWMKLVMILTIILLLVAIGIVLVIKLG